MTLIRAELARELNFGDDAVLSVMDADGVTTLLAALSMRGNTVRRGWSAMARFTISSSSPMPPISSCAVIAWCGTTDAGHQYVDISTPTDTLVLSRKEHV